MLELGEKAAKPVTTVWDWLSAFGSVKPLDSFYKGLWRFNICKVKPRDICFFFYTGPQAFQHLQMWNHKIFFRETSGQFQAVFVVTKNRFWVVFFLSQDTIFSQLYQVFFYAHTLPDHKHCIVTKQDVILNLKKCKKFQCNGVQELTNLPTFILSIWLQQPLKNVPVRVNQLLFVGQIKIKVLSSDMHCKLTATHAGECSHSPTSFILPKQYTYSLITLVLHCSSQMLITTSALDNAPKHFCSYISCRLSCN